MNPFHEASLDELRRILQIVDATRSSNKLVSVGKEVGTGTLSLNFMLKWVNGETLYPDQTTQSFIDYWERKIEDYL